MKRNTHALNFGLITSFLTGLGLTIVNPVLPFIINPLSNGHNQALIIALLSAAYAFCSFLAAPVLGSLSDHFGRKPLLLICLAGSSLGYLLFGLAGSLWILFLGRIIDGLTAGNIAVLFAYFADISNDDNRTKIFGWLAAAVGIGTITGPTLGGLLATFGSNIPFFFAAVISLINLFYGFFFMPESHQPEKAGSPLSIKNLNPIAQLTNLLRMRELTHLLATVFLIVLANAAIQSIISQFSLDSFAWQATSIGLVFSIMGLLDIITQSLIMPHLSKHFTDQVLTKLAIICEALGYLAISLSAILHLWPIFIIAMVIFAFGDSVFSTAFNAGLSKNVDSTKQGQVQGGSQALQSLARVIGPLVAGPLYIQFGKSAPSLFCFSILIIAYFVYSFVQSYLKPATKNSAKLMTEQQ